ncbi:succinate--CoA ligase subunit alpha [Methanocaldococcus indicus]|uniref:succinate--CoA ligase subunit alpha n=1 Tax=Methanocaldococcus indicus TaxID=213231 RepID=UPI003C6CF5B2
MILLDENTRAIVQGITGRQGSFHTKKMLEAGTKIVGGVTPGKGGKEVHGVKVYNTVREAVKETDANASVIFVPAPFAKDAVFEAMEYLDLVVVITEGIPIHDSMEFINYAEELGVNIIGPNTPGIASPKVGKLGIIPMEVLKEGNIGIVSRSGTLTYEIANQLKNNNLGVSTCVGIGGDPIIGLGFKEILKMFNEDEDTKAIVMVGEIGGSLEEEAAKIIKNLKKPVVGFIAGKSAPEGKRMGHAGAIIERGKGTAESKIKALKEAGAHVAENITDIPKILMEIL